MLNRIAEDGVLADIGDEQSISASLSTFSGHIANIAAIDRELVAKLQRVFERGDMGRELAERLGCALRGDPAIEITAIG